MPTEPEGYAKRRAMTVKNLFKNAKFRVDSVEFSDMTCSIGTAEVTGEIDKVKISETTDKLYKKTLRSPLPIQGKRRRLLARFAQKQPHILRPKRPPHGVALRPPTRDRSLRS